MSNNLKQTKNNLTAEDGGFAFSFSIISVLLVSIIFSTILTVLAGKNSSVLLSDAVIIISYLLSPIAMLLAIGILRSKNKKDILGGVLSKNFELKPLIASLLIAFGLMFGLSELNLNFVNWLTELGLNVSSPTLPSNTPLNVILVVVVVCLLPAVFEEFLFRGVILKCLTKTGVVFATLISGLLFSLFHMSPAQTIYQFAVGCLYSLIIIYGGNLLYLIVIHFINNLYIVLNYYYFHIVIESNDDISVCAVKNGFISIVVNRGAAVM